MQKFQRWVDEEVGLLKSLYPVTRVKYLQDKFPNRNKSTIVAKALSLGLISAKLWKPKENDILRKYFTKASRQELLELLPQRSWGAIVARGERLGLKRKINRPKLPVDENYFKQWCQNMAYILGFILADGCIIKGTYKGYSDSLKFGVQLKDIDILGKIKAELNADHKISLINNAAHLGISSQIIVDDLKKLGISYRKSLKEEVPRVPEIFIRDFIRGVVDGDGAVRIDNKGKPRISVCGGKVVVKYIRDMLLMKLGKYSKISERYNNSDYPLCAISYSCNSAIKIIDYLYSDSRLHLDRKYNLAKQCIKIKIKERKNMVQSKIGISL